MSEFMSLWKFDGDGEVEYEYGTIDEVAKMIAEGYEVFLDEDKTKNAKDLDFGYLTITSRYIEACEDDDVLFMPDLWDVVDSEEETTDVFDKPIKLSAEGRALALRWLDDAAVGYDLCFGRMKGVAGQYSSQELWELIKNDSYYHK